MFLPAKNDQFHFKFPKAFFPGEISKKYEKLLTRMPTPIEEFSEFINHTIQSVTFPSLTQQPVQQIGRIGKQRDFRASTPPPDLITRQMTVSFYNVEGFINYWAMYEIFDYYYKFDNPKTHFDQIVFRTIDWSEYVIATITLKEILFTDIGEIPFSYGDITPDFATFDCTFVFNDFDISLDTQ